MATEAERTPQLQNGEDEVDAVIKKREREAMHRFQNDHAIIHDNIKLIQGLRHPTTDEERGVMEMISEKEATFSGELQSSFFLFRGSEICRFVGKIRLNNGVHGTGFMVSKRLLMTCHHVFNMKASAHCNVGYVKFGTIDPFAGFPRPLKEAEFQLKPGTFYYESEELDLALIAVAKRAVQPAGYHLSNIGHCMAVNDADVTPGQHVNIIQFPSSSDPQKMILRQNQVVQVDEQYVKFLEVEFIQSHQYMASEDEADGPGGVAHQYETFKHVGDTHPGSSGAPSFDDEWRLIGMHHAALYVGHSNQDKKYVANEAASIAAIIAHIKENITEAEMPPEKYCLRKLGKPFEKSSSSSLFGWFSWPNSG